MTDKVESSRLLAGVDFNTLATIEHGRNLAMGWWDHADSLNRTMVRASKLLLMHSEISEATEGLRTDAMDSHLPDRRSVEVEIIDVLVRIMDFAGEMKLDLNGAWDDKTAFNRTRADHKRENRSAAGGKKF